MYSTKRENGYPQNAITTVEGATDIQVRKIISERSAI